MTDRELMQQALDALTKLMHEDLFNPAENAIEALRARLAQPDAVINGMPAYEGSLSKSQRLAEPEPKIYSDIDEMFRDMGVPVTEPEPVAYDVDGATVYIKPPVHNGKYLTGYTAPPQREWQGLTLEEREELRDKYEGSGSGFISAIEAKLKEKNT